MQIPIGRTILGGAVALLVIATTLFAAGPVVSNVRAAQRAGTKLVDIWYDLADADGNQCSISAAEKKCENHVQKIKAAVSWDSPPYRNPWSGAVSHRAAGRVRRRTRRRTSLHSSYGLRSIARRKSRFILAMKLPLMPLGQTAWHESVTVQAPNPSLSI